jgi:uncharacterized protein (TIGR02646 family)
MKYIQKGAEPKELAEFRTRYADSGTTPTWGDLNGEAELVEALRRRLFEEQGHLCCYCGRRVVANDNHIEHFVPRDDKYGNSALTFVWSNLLASCQANLMRGDPRHCGNAKGNWYESNLMLSPLEKTCEQRFRFELDGRIRPSMDEDVAAAETIRHLDLDGARLRALRSKAIEGLFEGLDGELMPNDYDILAAKLLEKDAAGKFEPFCIVLVAALAFFRE